jgi:hypothetical protein
VGISHLEQILVDTSKVLDHAISSLERLDCTWFELGFQLFLSISSSAVKNVVHASLFVGIVVGVYREFAIHLNLPSVKSWVYPICKNWWVWQLGGFS